MAWPVAVSSYVCWKSDRLSRGIYPAPALMEFVETPYEGLEPSVGIAVLGNHRPPSQSSKTVLSTVYVGGGLKMTADA